MNLYSLARLALWCRRTSKMLVLNCLASSDTSVVRAPGSCGLRQRRRNEEGPVIGWAEERRAVVWRVQLWMHEPAFSSTTA
jgi:hypothetical protein